jgi:hypothetical protein
MAKVADQIAHDMAPFVHKEYDVSCCLQPLFCTGTVYKLEPEFLVIEESSLCGINRHRVPYGEVNVDKATCCCCSSINNQNPGCCFNGNLVNEIADELQRRVAGRGITAQVQKAEIMNNTVVRLETKIDFIHNEVQLLQAKLDSLIQKMDR